MGVRERTKETRETREKKIYNLHTLHSTSHQSPATSHSPDSHIFVIIGNIYQQTIHIYLHLFHNYKDLKTLYLLFLLTSRKY
ncbi:hypothetical protein [Chroococcidiopsis thermalis]|uniref:hypothetical protein n=1 Tax=Chroococcidiopsis thermalis TaxID=54299 RepID=UPI0003068E90|nr:hypothetical protein [Chroococcidiopsis thermalis]